MSGFIAKLEAAEYIWNHSYLSPLAMAEIIPLRDLPAFDWILKVSQTLLDSIDNTVALDASLAFEKDFQTKVAALRAAVETRQVDLRLLREVAGDLTLYGRLTADKGSGRAQSIDDYAKLFKTIGLPAVAADYNQDSVFAAMRTAGPNPLMIHRVAELPDHFPVTEPQYTSVMTGDSLAAALAAGRIYICDYAVLSETEIDPAVSPVKFLYAPIALFAAHPSTGALIPVAIQTQQTPVRAGAANNLFLADGSYNWLIAKTIVEMADGNVHEAVMHLGRTHLLMEPFVVATGHNLPPSHPIFQLLWPHFEGTLFINGVAVRTLVAPGGAVEELDNATLKSTLKMTVSQLLNYPFNDAFLPNNFRGRDVLDLKDYAYRDDSLLYWKVIRDWVSAYVALYYANDAAVASDAALQAWCRDLISSNGGRVPGFGLGGGIPNLGYLIDAVTMIIFTSSVQHAAVNFPQLDLMTYCPNMPLACYSQFPGATPAGEREYLDILPPISRAKLQLNVGYGLGAMHYTELGGYRAGHFGPVVTGPLATFQSDVRDAGQTILNRNTLRRPYTTLLPTAIPQSINI